MKSIDFQFLLTNAAFPATVVLTRSNLKIEFLEVPCEFSLIENFSIVQSLKSSHIQSQSMPSLVFEYSKPSSKLSLFFSLKEFCTQGRSQMHELPNTIERHINSMMLHTRIISNNLESAISELSSSYSMRVKHLSHSSATVSIDSKTFGEIEVKTMSKTPSSLAFQSVLLTTRLFEHYFDLNKPVNLSETFEQLAISCEFQLTLNEVLKTLASQASRPYTSWSYSFCGLSCTANYYNEVHLCYMKEIIVKIRVSSFPYTLEVLDMHHFNKSLMFIRKFEGCLHHCVTKALKDETLAGRKNTVDPKKEPGLFQVLELHKPQHVKNALILIINYVQLTYIFEKSRLLLVEHVRNLQLIAKGNFVVYQMLDLKADFSQIHELNFALTLKMKPLDIGLDIDIDVESKPSKENEQERLEQWKKTLLFYFSTCIKEHVRGNPDIMLGFIKLFLVKSRYLNTFIEILEEEIHSKERLEVVWPALNLKPDLYRFVVRVWDVQGKSSDINFLLKISQGEPEISTNFDPTILASLHYSTCRPVDVLRLALSRRADEMKLSRVSEN